MKINYKLIVILAPLMLASPQKVMAGTDTFIGEIMWTASTFCPRSYTDANGQLLSISQYTALFSLLGTTYGGDGRTTFALPDLRGRSMVHAGTAAGLSAIRQGDKGGNEKVILSANQMPSHNHNVKLLGTNSAGNADSPTNTVLASKDRSNNFNSTVTANAPMSSSAISQDNIGSNLSISTRSPYLGLRACIALIGIFPSRS